MHFALLRTIAERNGLPGLSMGMSGDYEEAVRLVPRRSAWDAIFRETPSPGRSDRTRWSRCNNDCVGRSAGLSEPAP